jgi:8-oxo-dGTP pyrophosphatase MutT (NUDIX family)
VSTRLAVKLSGLDITVEYVCVSEGAFAFVVRGSKVLLLKRARGGLFGDLWYIPGGFVDPGERPIEAAVREVREETGLELGHVELFREWEHLDADGTARMVVVRAASPAGDVTLNDEHSEFLWGDPSDVLAQDLSVRAAESRFFAEWWAGAQLDFRQLALLLARGRQ